MKVGHYVILHTFQQNPSTLFCLLLPCVKCDSITRSRFWNLCIYELLQPIIIQHRLHPVLPCNIIRAAIKDILQSQYVEIHFNECSTSTPRKHCSKFEFHQHKTQPLQQLQSALINITPITCINYITYVLYIQYFRDHTLF